jgi:hypothetical protein
MSQTKAQLIEGNAASEITAAKTLLGAGSVGAPSLTVTGDTNTGIYFPAADTIGFVEGGVEAARIDSSGRLLVGTSTASGSGGSRLEVAKQTITTSDMGLASFQLVSDSTRWPQVFLEKSRGTAVGDKTLVVDGDSLGELSFRGADGTNYLTGANIIATVDGTTGANDLPTRLVFSTTADGAASPTEKMRINNVGDVFVGTTSSPDGTTGGSGFTVESNNRRTLRIASTVADAGRVLVRFFNPNGQVGSIATNANSTSFITSSDYRLKENVVPLSGAIDRLQQIPVHRFNFIVDPDTTVDGFLAHEAQEIVPECVTGTKDEVDEDGNPVYQGIDQSKLVPLLTAALQEALAEIESLKARVTALEP